MRAGRRGRGGGGEAAGARPRPEHPDLLPERQRRAGGGDELPQHPAPRGEGAAVRGGRPGAVRGIVAGPAQAREVRPPGQLARHLPDRAGGRRGRGPEGARRGRPRPAPPGEGGRARRPHPVLADRRGAELRRPEGAAEVRPGREAAGRVVRPGGGRGGGGGPGREAAGGGRRPRQGARRVERRPGRAAVAEPDAEEEVTPRGPPVPRLLLALLAAVLGRPTAAADPPRPNFVFLFADDQRYDALGVVQKEHGAKGRFPWFKTPNMDRLAADGVRFRNAFVVNALCSPSRACFLSGRYSHANGIWDNRTPLDEGLATHATLLRAAGYSTGYVGKWHQGTQPARPGFDWSASFTGQGAYFGANFLVNGKSEKADDWTDDRSAAYAVRFLEADRAKDKPFLLVVGFKAPHGPFDPPKRLADAFAGEVARAVPSLGLLPGFNPGVGKPKEVGETVPVNLNYFRCVAGVDENVGKVLDALDRLKLAGNTVVVYSSDNGYYHGEHGLGDKRSAYEESMRIPLLVRDPRSGPGGVTRDDLVLNVDLAPTLLDLAGVPVPKEMHGKSWRPLLAKDPPRGPFRASFFYEYFREDGPKKGAPAATPGGYNTPTTTAVRTAAHKLIRYRDRPEWTELFDLAADPYETKNRFAAPALAEVRAALEKEHDRLAKELGYAVPAGVPAEPKR
ncbi:MAG: hypothetical protein C0501_01825 [Isosphaera sp.]|nr:hypothetical protein [Isosphaera sp.]